MAIYTKLLEAFLSRYQTTGRIMISEACSRDIFRKFEVVPGRQTLVAPIVAQEVGLRLHPCRDIGAGRDWSDSFCRRLGVARDGFWPCFSFAGSAPSRMDRSRLAAGRMASSDSRVFSQGREKEASQALWRPTPIALWTLLRGQKK